jgi:hypothetical protein
MIKSVNKDGVVTIHIPKELGERVEILVFPAAPDQAESEAIQYFECIAEDGTEYRVADWTDEDFNRLSKRGAFKDDDTAAEDVFDV